MRLAILALSIVVSGLSPAHGRAQAESVEVRVGPVRGSLPRRTLERALRPDRLATCQHTFNGGPLSLDVRVLDDGSLEVTRARGTEEVRGYLSCVRRHLARIEVGAQHASSRARIVIEFPSLGLGLR